ncbi:homeodomain-interacting protein kinase 2-like [Pseudochaenichthys georgianus]|uniref:homeodomain-interacting protein kinase 2-like n=1 Tax=Pseudochaenichthys georgianus TaxID=52239 RepID=UPI0039C2002E
MRGMNSQRCHIPCSRCLQEEPVSITFGYVQCRTKTSTLNRLHLETIEEPFIAKMSQTFQVEREDIISSKSAEYRVLDFIGEGRFDEVAKCVLEEDLDCSPYVTDDVWWMTLCRLDHSEPSDVPVNDYETDSSGGEKDMEISCDADARPDGFCQDPPITSFRESSQKEQPMTSIAHNSNLEKSNIDTPHNESTPNANDGAAAAITPTDQGDVDKTRTGLPKRRNVFQRMRKRVVSFYRRFNASNHNSNLEKSEDLGSSSFVKEAGSLSSICTLDPSDSSDVANNSETFPVEKEDIISSMSAEYQVLDFIGEGVFGKVAKCVNLKTSEIIAIKIHKDSEDRVEEVRMLEIIRKLDPEKNNLIRCIDNFFFGDVSCLAFEMLDQSLLDFMINRKKAYTLNEIRPITQQLLVAFRALKSIGIIHADLKHDNIMLVNHQNQPFRIKLIDFGEAIPTSEVEIGTEKQPLSYRAPEVYLGLPISEAIDMWSLGCIIAGMYIFAHVFVHGSKYSIMKVICHLIGQPGDHLLNAGKFSSKYFIRERENSPEWRFKTPEEYKKRTGVEADISECALDQYSSLDEKLEYYVGEQGRVELKDRMAFVQLLKRLFDLDANSRITPEQALTHSFVTMGHLEEDLDCSPYVTDAVRWMAICRLDHSEPSDVPVNDYETDSSGGEKDMEISCDADARPDGFCQDPPITSFRESSQKEQPMTSIAHNSNLEKSNIDTTHNESTPNANDGAAAAITPTDQGDVDKTRTGLPKRRNVFQRMRKRVVSFFRRFKK